MNVDEPRKGEASRLTKAWIKPSTFQFVGVGFSFYLQGREDMMNV